MGCHVYFAVALGLAVVGCGTSPRDPSGDNDGGGAPRVIRSCTNLHFPDPRGLASCPPPNEQPTASSTTSAVVIGATDNCSVGRFMGDASSGDFVIWEFQESSGNRVAGGFTVDGLDNSALSAGDSVVIRQSFSLAPAPDIDARDPRGYFVVERDAMPVVFFMFGVTPNPPLFPDFEITPDEFECGGRMDSECGGRRRMRVTANGESAVLAMGESAELSSYVFRSGGMSDNRTCDPSTVFGER